MALFMAQNPRPRRPWEEGASALVPPPPIARGQTEQPQDPTSNRQALELQALDLPSSSLSTSRQERTVGQSLPSLRPYFTSSHDSKRSLEQPPVEYDSTVQELPLSKRRRIDEEMAGSHAECCSAACSGTQCSTLRELVSSLNDEISIHEFLVHGSSANDPQSSAQVSLHPSLISLLKTIHRRLHQSNASLKMLLKGTGLQQPYLPGQSTTDNRRDSNSSTTHHASMKIDRERTSPNSIPSARSRLQTVGHTPPSPVSLNISNPSSVPPTLSLAAAPDSPSSISQPNVTPAAYQAHIEDLQHQLSIKTLALTSLKMEHNLLYQKLDRQRIKCGALERKFEVSDAEINSLHNEKEKMEEQIEGLEAKVAQLEEERDNAVKSSHESSGQWKRIVEMAGRLHGDMVGGDGPSGLDKSWPEEKEKLYRRIKDLETELSAVSTGVRTVEDDIAGSSGVLQDAVQAGVVRLEEELARLQERNFKLEGGLTAAKQAALNLAVQGQNLSAVIRKALEAD